MGSDWEGVESSRSEVAEWEEPRHPGPAVREGTYPTLPHYATQLAFFVPQTATTVRLQTHFPCKPAISCVGRPRGGRASTTHDRVQTRRLHAELQSAGRARTLRRPCRAP